MMKKEHMMLSITMLQQHSFTSLDNCIASWTSDQLRPLLKAILSTANIAAI